MYTFRYLGLDLGGGMVKVVLWLKTGDIDDWGDI